MCPCPGPFTESSVGCVFESSPEHVEGGGGEGKERADQQPCGDSDADEAQGLEQNVLRRQR